MLGHVNGPATAASCSPGCDGLPACAGPGGIAATPGGARSRSPPPLAGNLASPQLSIPGTPTDYTAFSVLQQDVLLCNTNSIFSPMPEEFSQPTGVAPHIALHPLPILTSMACDRSERVCYPPYSQFCPSIC